MKNYTFDEIKEKSFICYYEKTKENIIIHNADGSIEEIPNIIHNEQNILNRMKSQIELAEDFQKYIKKILISNSLVGVSAVVFIALQTYLNNIGETTLPSDISVFIALISSIMVSYGIKDSIANLEDYNKNKMFLDNEELLNNYFKDDNLTINDIHFMNCKDLKKMIINIKKCQ